MIIERRIGVVKNKLLLLVLLLSFIMPTFTYANNVNEKNSPAKIEFEITNPKEDSAVVTSENIVLTGIGEEKDKLEVQVYSVKRSIAKGKEKVIKKLDNSYELEIDALKLFAQEIELKEGENQVTIIVTRNNKKYTFNRTVNFFKNGMGLTKIIEQIK